MPDDRFMRAVNLRKDGKYAEAGALFHELWDATGSAGAASGYMHCLRKTGHPEAAIKVGGDARDSYPKDVWIRRELVWAYYDAYIKPNKGQGNLTGLLKAAQRIIALDPEEMPLRLTVFAVIAVAKQRNQWQIVSEWCDRLDPNHLSDEAPLIGGRRGRSDRQRWYFAKVRSLVELQQWDMARAQALEAAHLYPREINFPRWAALALAGQGQVERAIAELEEIVLKNRAEWWLLEDLCKLNFDLGRLEAALRFGCQAALAPGEDRHKVTLYLHLGQIGLAADDLDFAAQQAALSKAVRKREGWRIPSALTRLEADIRGTLHEAGREWPVDNADVGTLSRLCQRDWRANAYAGLPRKTGVIESLPPGKAHGWIRADDGERVFFLQRDLPDSGTQEEARLNFALAPSWDRKRDELSVRAVDFQVAEG